MEFMDPSISSLDAAVRFGLELGHDLHAIEVVENEVLDSSGGKDFKLSHDYEDETSLQTFVGPSLKETFLSKLEPDSAATVNLDNVTCCNQQLHSTTMELHNRIECLELQLESKERELVACKDDLACLQRSHVELVVSNDKLLHLYEKNKSKRSVLSDSESRACRMNERRQREKAERLATTYKSLLDEQKSLEGSAESRYRNLVRSYAKLSAENRHLRGELMQHKGLKSKLSYQNSLEMPPSWPVLPPPLKGLDLPDGGDSTHAAPSPPPNNLKEECDTHHDEHSSGTVLNSS